MSEFQRPPMGPENDRPSQPADLEAAIDRFKPKQAEATKREEDEGLSRRDLLLGALGFALGGGFAGNEIGNLARANAETNALSEAESALDQSEIQAADLLAEALTKKVEEFAASLEGKNISDVEKEEKIKAYVLRVLDTFNKKEIVPLIVPSSDTSLISKG